jgi:hypothetical protein
METPAYKISCKTNSEAILVSMLIEDAKGIVCDCRESKELIYSKEALDLEGVDKEDLVHLLEDACMIGELDYTPDFEETEFDFDEVEAGE